MIPSETKLHYIVEFQELEKTIMDRAKAMDEAIKNGEDYASLIEKAKEKGLSDIQIAKSSSIDELKQLANSHISDLEIKRKHIQEHSMSKSDIWMRNMKPSSSQ